MNLGRTLVFSFLFALVCGVAIYQTRLDKQIQTFVPDEVNRNVLFDTQDAIRHIEILDRVKKTETVLRKENDRWYLESPVRCLAETRIADGMVMTARAASRQPRLRGEKDWGEYGLSRPDIEVRLDVPGKKAETLLLGGTAPFGNAVFARWDSERGYMLLPREMKEVFNQGLYALRDKRVFLTPGESVRKLYVEMGDLVYQWKKEEGQWYWMEPLTKFGEKISQEKIDNLLTALQGLYVKKFMDDEKRSRAELGFFIIHDRIKIESEFDLPEVFHFGNEVPLENAFYGLRENDGAVFLIDRGKVIEWYDLLKKMGAVSNE